MSRIRPSQPVNVSGGSSGGTGAPVGSAVLVETVARILVVQETNAAPSEAVTFIAKITETNTGQSEVIVAIPPGPKETNATQGETITRTTSTWATSQSTAGTAPVNPTNALAEVNGTTATVKAGGIANGTSTLTNTIPVASIPSGTRTLRCYYQTVAGVTDTFTLGFTNTGGSPASGNLPEGNFLTTPYDLELSTIGSALSVAFTHAASIPGTGGQINVDATGVKTT